MSLRLNAYTLRFSADTFTAFRTDLPEPRHLKALREHLGRDWFLHWRNGFACGMPVLPPLNLLLEARQFSTPRTMKAFLF